MTALYIALAAAAAILLRLYLAKPSAARNRVRPYRGALFAHRGFHDESRGVVENTLPAFRAALEKGCGIELDIQMTSDRVTVVYHDATLRRLTGDSRRLSSVSYAELRGMRLAGVSDARIPTLEEVLTLADGRGPILIELKTGRNNAILCQSLLDHLSQHPGAYLIESFDPRILFWFRRRAPGLPRGQLTASFSTLRENAGPIGAFVLSRTLLNALSRPDFIACEAGMRLPLHRRFFHTPTAVWTVTDEKAAARLRAAGDAVIFEGCEIKP